jgi:hypothetical protein
MKKVNTAGAQEIEHCVTADLLERGYHVNDGIGSVSRQSHGE